MKQTSNRNVARAMKRQALKKEMERQNSAIFQQKLIEKVITDIDSLVIQSIDKHDPKKKKRNKKPPRRNAMCLGTTTLSSEDYARRQSPHSSTQDETTNNDVNMSTNS